MQVSGWTRVEVIGIVAILAIAIGLEAWLGTHTEGATLLVVLLAVYVLLGLVLRVTTLLYAPSAAGEGRSTRVSTIARATSPEEKD